MSSRMWRQELLPPLLLVIVTRLALFAAVWASLRAVPRLSLYPAQLPDSFLPDYPSLDGWARWDAAHYIAIAGLGYGAEGNTSPNGGYGFLPVFPLLLRALVALPGVRDTPGAYAVTGIVAANALMLVAVTLFVMLARRHVSRPATVTAVLLLTLGPFGFFLSSAYSESLFIALCLGALLLADRGKWPHAGAIGALASATRIAGVFLAPALLYAAWKAGVRGWRLATTGLLPLGGFALWSLYTAWKIDDPLAYFDSQSEWGGWTEHVRFYAELLWNEPLTMLRGDPRHLVILLNMAVAALFLALLPAVWKRTSPALAVFTLCIVCFHAGWTWVSLGRYLLPAFGVFIVAGDLLTRSRFAGWPRDVVIASAAIASTTLAILFAHGFWVV